MLPSEGRPICKGKIQVQIEVEGGVVIDVNVTDAQGNPLEFEYALDDHDTEGEGDEPYEIDDAGFEVEDKDGSATQGPVRP